MNSPAVAAVLPPQVEAKTIRIQKTPPDGFMQALSEQCKAQESRESEPLPGTAAPNAQETMPSHDEPAAAPESTVAVSDDSNQTECATPSSTDDWASLYALLTQWPFMPATIDGETGAAESSFRSSHINNVSGHIVSSDIPLAESVSAAGSVEQGGSTAIEAGKPADLSRFVQALLQASANTTKPASPSPVLEMDALAAASSMAQTVAGASVKITAETPETGAYPISRQTESDTDSMDATGLRVLVSSPDAPKAAPATVPQGEPAAWQRISPAMLQEVALRGVRYLIAENEKTIAVHLVPPSLGELRIEVSMASDVLHVKFYTSNPVVRDAIENHLQALRDTFAANHLDVKNISVASGMAGQASSHSFTGSQFTDLAATGIPRITAAIDQSAASAEPRPSVVRRIPHDGALNILI